MKPLPLSFWIVISVFALISGLGCNYSIFGSTPPTPTPPVKPFILLVAAEGTYEIPLNEGIQVENLSFINRGENLEMIFEGVGHVVCYPEDNYWVTASWKIERLENKGNSAVFKVTHQLPPTD